MSEKEIKLGWGGGHRLTRVFLGEERQRARENKRENELRERVERHVPNT